MQNRKKQTNSFMAENSDLASLLVCKDKCKEFGGEEKIQVQSSLFNPDAINPDVSSSGRFF
jgi:hypothetical protein